MEAYASVLNPRPEPGTCRHTRRLIGSATRRSATAKKSKSKSKSKSKTVTVAPFKAIPPIQRDASTVIVRCTDFKRQL